jgi:hypothetical protein
MDTRNGMMPHGGMVVSWALAVVAVAQRVNALKVEVARG